MRQSCRQAQTAAELAVQPQTLVLGVAAGAHILLQEYLQIHMWAVKHVLVNTEATLPFCNPPLSLTGCWIWPTPFPGYKPPVLAQKVHKPSSALQEGWCKPEPQVLNLLSAVLEGLAHHPIKANSIEDGHDGQGEVPQQMLHTAHLASILTYQVMHLLPG